MFNRCIIIGSGASVRQSLWDISINKLPVWNLIKNEITFGLNWSYKWLEPTAQLFMDYQFYISFQNQLDKLPLVIGKDNPKIGISEYESNKKCIPGNNLILLPPADKYYGEESWSKGFGKAQLVGLFSLTLACILGFKNIYLLGFDCCEIEGRTHFYQGDKENTGKFIWQRKEHNGMGKIKGRYRTNDYDKDISKEYFDAYIPELKKRNIWNVSLQSKITSFPKITYNEFYKTLEVNPNEFSQQEIRNFIISTCKSKLKYNPINRKKQILL